MEEKKTKYSIENDFNIFKHENENDLLYLENVITKLEKKYLPEVNEKYSKLVNFFENKKEKIHNWFYYKEGYSSLLVEKLLNEFDAKENEILLDPFSGSGTTLVVGKEQKMKTIGFDVNPIASFISEVKTRNYCEDDIKSLQQVMLELEREDLEYDDKILEKPKLDIIDKIFSEDKLKKLLHINNYIKKIENKKIKNIVKLAYLQSIENLSKMKKDGNGIKYKTKESETEVLIEIKNNLNKILESILEKKEIFFTGKESILIKDSYLNSEKYIAEKIDYVICSPPYANCFDYCAVYKMELWLGEFVKEYKDFKKLRGLAIRSHVNGSLEQKIENEYDLIKWISSKIGEEKLWDKKIPHMINSYFDDMTKVIKNINFQLKEKGKCAIVVGNSSYNGFVVPTDLLLAYISEKNGFEVKNIYIARPLRTSSQQMKKFPYIKKYLRESIIVLEKRSLNV